MQPASSPDRRATVSNIQLTEFTYESDYDFENLSAVDLNVSVLTRTSAESNQCDVLVTIAYIDQNTTVSVLKAACLTSYAIREIAAETDPQSGEKTLNIPDALFARLRVEAVAHARALVAGQAAATPFGKTYALTPPFRAEAEAAEQ